MSEQDGPVVVVQAGLASAAGECGPASREPVPGEAISDEEDED